MASSGSGAGLVPRGRVWLRPVLHGLLLRAPSAVGPAALLIEVAHSFGRAPDETRDKEAGRQGSRRDRHRPAAHHRLYVVEDVRNVAGPDRVGELLQPLHGTIHDGAELRPILESL